MAELLRALRDGWVRVNGRTVLVNTGDLAATDDPVVAAAPEMFGPLRVRFPGAVPPVLPVEQATAAPGERRKRAHA